MLIRRNIYDRPIFRRDKLGLLVITRRWIIATRIYANIYA